MLAPLDAHVRSSALRILALPFRYPEEEVFEAFRSGEYEESLRDHGALVPHLAAALGRARPDLEAARAELASTDFVQFEVAFTGTFVAGMPEPPCPPYEGLVRTNENRVAILLELSDFYRHFDLRMDPSEGRNEHQDHLRAEIEVLQFLCLKEAQARREGTPDLLHGYVLAQRDFIARHLARWVGPFANRLRAGAKHPWFAACARVLADHVAGELALVEGYLPGLAAAAGTGARGADSPPAASGRESAEAR